MDERVRPSLRLLPLSLCIAMALPAHAADDQEDWGLCPVEDIVPPFADAPPPRGLPGIRIQQPTDIEGDALAASETQESIFQGNVALSRGDQFLGTDKLTYDSQTGNYAAEGSVRYQDSGMRIVAQRAEGNQDADTHTIHDLRYQLTQRRGNGGANRIELSGAKGALVGSTYSTCPPSQRAWELRARRIDVNTDEGMAIARGATLRIGKVPVLHVPWFMFPVDDRRRTGLLYPSVSMSGRNGFDWKQPIYLNLAPNYDATLIPRIMSARGATLGGEFRWLYPEGRGQVSGNWMPDDALPRDEPWRYLNDLSGNPIPGESLPDKNRGQFTLSALHGLGPQWHSRANVGWVSDTHYLEDFSSSSVGVSSYFLQSTLGLYGRGQNWEAEFNTIYTQLADYTLTEGDLPYHRLPRAAVNWAQPLGWLKAGVSAEAVRFQHEVFDAGSRLDIKPFISMPLEGASWFVTPKVAWRYTGYQLDEGLGAALGDKSPSRSLPIYSLDAGLFFDRHTEIRGDSYLHTLEPRIYYLNVPYRDQSGLPQFDTTPMTFSWGQLFRDNRYTGADRQTDANQLTVAVTNRLISEEDGRERLTASLGQIHYFDESRVTTPGETAVAQGKSAWVADVGVSPNDRWSINAAYQWDPKLRGQDLASLRARYLFGDNGVANLGYRYRRNTAFRPGIDPDSAKDQLEQVDFSFLYPITPNWSVVGRYYYSILDKKELETIAGVQWESCCLAVRLIGRRYVRNRTGDLNNSLMLEFELKGLGSAGQDTERVLRRGILGYERDDLYLVPPSQAIRGNVDPSPDPSP
ncbi:LPS-assembly protein LptD [Lysobacter olei]